MNACSSACGYCGRCTDDDDARPNWGLERTCQDCGDPVMVDPREAYALHVYCPTCQAKPDARINPVTPQRTGAA